MPQVWAILTRSHTSGDYCINSATKNGAVLGDFRFFYFIICWKIKHIIFNSSACYMKVCLLYILINVIHLFTAERAEASPHLGVLQSGLSHGSAEAAGVRCLRNTQGRCPSGQCVPRPWDQLFHWEGVRPQARRHDQDAIRTSVRHERNHVGLQGLQFVPLPLWWVPAEDYELDDLSYPLSNIVLD